jgi:protein phosphatase
MSMTNPGDTAEFALPRDSRARFFGPTPPRMSVEAGALTHPGKVRSTNEDHFAVVRRRRSRIVLFTNLPEGDLPNVDEDGYGMVVADGVGGSVFGELASRLVLRTAGELGLSELKWPLKMNDTEAQEVMEKMETYVQLLHESFLEKALDDPRLAGMGTTLTVAYSVGTEAFIGHIGDSRAYHWRGGALRRLTRDHTLAQKILDSGLTLFDASQMRYMSRVLTNCINTRDEPIFADVLHLTLQHEDRLLLCTDGLSDLVADEEMNQVLTRQTNSQQACQELVDLAMERGGTDNVTVIVARYELLDPGPAGSFREQS